MDLDSDEEKHYTFTDTEGEEEPCPSSWQSSSSQPLSPDFSASVSEVEDDVGNMAGQHPQLSQWTLPPKPRRHVVQTFNGSPNGERSVAEHIMQEPTPLSILLLFFMEFITLLVVDTNHYYYQFLDNSDNGPSPHCEVTKAEMSMFLALTLQMRQQFKADWRTIGWKWNSFAVQSTDKWWYMLGIITYYAFYISQTILGMELAGWMTDCGKYETYLKF